jgi:hypothetical protein
MLVCPFSQDILKGLQGGGKHETLHRVLAGVIGGVSLVSNPVQEAVIGLPLGKDESSLIIGVMKIPQPFNPLKPPIKAFEGVHDLRMFIINFKRFLQCPKGGSRVRGVQIFIGFLNEPPY